SKPEQPEISSETLTYYNPEGKPTSSVETEYLRGKKTRTVEFQRDAGGRLFGEHATLYRPDGLRVREELFDTYYPDGEPALLRARVRTLQDEYGRTVLISSEHYAKTLEPPPKLLSGTRQVFEYASPEA